MTKLNIKNKAIQLRQKGLTYSEILKEVKAAKSTLSLWLRSVELAKKQNQRLTDKKRLSALRGSSERKRQRIEKEAIIKKNACSEIGIISEREEWLCGAMLYWAEGSKQKKSNVSVGIKFSNSDPIMLTFFISWLKRYLNVADKDIIFEIYIHELYRAKKEDLKNYWARKLNYPVGMFNKVYFKKNILKTKRKNVGVKYHGQLNIKVRKSTNLNRKISGWIEGFTEKQELLCPIV